MIPLPVRPIACTSMARCGRRRVGRQMQSVISSRELQQSHSNGRDCGRAQKSPSPDAGWASFVSNATAARAQPNGCPKAAPAQSYRLSASCSDIRRRPTSPLPSVEKQLRGWSGKVRPSPYGKPLNMGRDRLAPNPTPRSRGWKGGRRNARAPTPYFVTVDLFRDRRPIS